MNNLVSVRSSVRRKPQTVELTLYGSQTNTKHNAKNKIYNNVLETIGNTPLIRLNKVPKDHGVECEIYAKCEFFNPAGSIKDRIGYSMLEDAKKKGHVHNDTELVEPTSGNTGIGIALSTAISGNKSYFVSEEKNMGEKVDTMRLLGAEVIKTKDNATELKLAKEILEENPKTFIMLDQFNNEVNPKTHYDTTGVEIADALDHLDMIVMGAGTGGTITGVAKRLKQEFPGIIVSAIDPDGSTMINSHGKEHPYLVEGIGGTWVPKVFDESVIDHLEVVTDEEAFIMARELARKEGLLCGGSSGACMAGAIKAIQALNLGAGKRVVVVLPDGIRNYMSKFVSDQWMEARLFKDPPQHSMKWWNKPITDLTPIINRKNNSMSIDKNTTCKKALQIMKQFSFAVVVDMDNDKRYVGALSKDSLRKSITSPTTLPNGKCIHFDFTDPVTDHLSKHCYTLAENGKKGMPTIGLLSRILDIAPFVVIGNKCDNNFIPSCVVTGDDVLDYIFEKYPDDHGC